MSEDTEEAAWTAGEGDGFPGGGACIGSEGAECRNGPRSLEVGVVFDGVKVVRRGGEVDRSEIAKIAHLVGIGDAIVVGIRAAEGGGE